MYTETHTLILSEDGLAAHRSLALVRTKIGAAGLRPTRPRFESVFYETSGGLMRQAPPSNTICPKKRERGAERPHTRDQFLCDDEVVDKKKRALEKLGEFNYTRFSS